MTSTSIDDILIDVADRFAGAIQRRGLPLPMAHLLALGTSVPGVGCIVVGILHGPALPGPSYLTPALVGLNLAFFFYVLSFLFWGHGQKLVGDARSWSPSRAARYRGEAIRARVMQVEQRLWKLWGLPVVVLGILDAAARGLNPTHLLVGGAGAFTLGIAILDYVACSLPRDPDLGARLAFPSLN